MVTIKLYGDLKNFGSEFFVDVRTVSEALRALFYQLPGFKNHIRKGEYHVTVDGVEVNSETVHRSVNSSIHITPVVSGAGKGVLQTIVGVTLIVVGAVTANPAVIQAGVGLALGGVAQMLSKTPDSSVNSDNNDKMRSSSFSNLDNRQAQGTPVSLIYGTMMVGSQVLSQGIRSENRGESNETESSVVTVTVESRNLITPEPFVDGYNYDSENLTVKNRNYVTTYIEQTVEGNG